MINWLQEQERILTIPSRGGRYPEIVNSYVVPGLLGLFQAAFGQRPTSTAGRPGGEGGHAARFIETVIREVRHSIEKIGFDPEIYGPDRRKELTQQWSANSPDWLEQMIVRGLKQRRPAEEFDPVTGIGPLPERLEWEVWSRFYAAQLGTNIQG